jgi:hypothetical protein
MRRRFPILLGMGLAVLVTLAEQPSFKPRTDVAEADKLRQMSGAELQRHCADTVDVRLRCGVHLESVAAALHDSFATGARNRLCLPDNVDVERLRMAFLRYATDHPDRLPQPATEMVGPALQTEYGCPPQSWQAWG